MLANIFGVPTSYESDRAQKLAGALSECWLLQFKARPGELRTDLDRLHTWFDPRASGSRLRSLIESLDLAPDMVVPPGFDPLFLSIDSDRHLVTPEGRVVLDLLDKTPPLHDLVLFSADDMAEAMAVLTETYSRWTTARLRKVAALLAGETETLRPGVTGLLLVLLVNRNTAEERSLRRPVGDEVRAREIEDAIATPANAWARTFSTRKTASRPFRLYQGWELGELHRRLGGTLVANDQRIFIREQGADAALNRIASDLERRPAGFRAKVPRAMHALLKEYEHSRPLLRGLGLGFDVPSVTAHIEERVLAAANLGDH